MRAIDWFVADKATKAALPPEALFHKHLKVHAFERGLLCYPGSGTVDGQVGDHVLLSPEFILEPVHIDELVSKISLSIDDAARTTGIL